MSDSPGKFVKLPINKNITIIEGLATGVPTYVTRQEDTADFVAKLPSLKRIRHRIHKIYQNTNIDTKYLALDLFAKENQEIYTGHLPIQDRMKIYQEKTIPLVEEVARNALMKAINDENSEQDLSKSNFLDSIQFVIVVSSTGFLAPGLDVELIKRLGLRRDIARTTVGFMGCAAAMNGMKIASDHVRAFPDHKTLLVCVELSSVNAVFEDNLNSAIIHSIFGDGCAAAVIGNSKKTISPKQIVLEKHFSYLTDHTEDGIVLELRQNGITCQLSPSLPRYIETNIRHCIEDCLEQQKLTLNDISFWGVHPGGTKILQAVQNSLKLQSEHLTESWEILHQYGNMLSPTILFVLERILNRKIETSKKHLSSDFQWGIAFSFAPGISIEGVLFRI